MGELTRVSDISRMMADRAESIVPMLLPGGKQVNGHWVCGDIHGGNGDSLKVNMHGQHVGEWRDWANDEHKGDLIDLLRLTRGITPPEAIKESKELLGIREDVRQYSHKAYSKPPEGVTRNLTDGGRAMRFLTSERKLRAETIAAFKVEILPDKAIAFPCYSPSGELVNRSYRTIPKPGQKKDVWQDKGCAPCLFGWQAVNPTDRSILICEGQIDAMTWFQWGIPALSVPNGSGLSWIEYEWDNLLVFDTIYLSFDMDGTGKKILADAIQRLGLHRCFIVSLPKKDANECLKHGCTSEDAQSWIAEAKEPALANLLHTKVLKGRVMEEIKSKKQPLTLPFFKILWPDDGFYPHPGDVTIWTGNTGAGKSTFLNYKIMCELSVGEKVFLASLEVKAERNIRKMATAMFGGKELNEQLVDEFIGEVGDNLIFADVVGYISPESLFEMMTFAYRRYGCKRFLIDSLMRITGLEEDYPRQGDFMNQLAKFAKDTGSWVDIVCHPRKMANGQSPSELDVKGSSLIPNNADNVVSISKNQEKEKLRKEGRDMKLWGYMHDAEIRVDKQREVGWTGLFKLKFDKRTFSYAKA